MVTTKEVRELEDEIVGLRNWLYKHHPDLLDEYEAQLGRPMKFRITK